MLLNAKVNKQKTRTLLHDKYKCIHHRLRVMYLTENLIERNEDRRKIGWVRQKDGVEDRERDRER
jgi:hypothetical protein